VLRGCVRQGDAQTLLSSALGHAEKTRIRRHALKRTRAQPRPISTHRGVRVRAASAHARAVRVGNVKASEGGGPRGAHSCSPGPPRCEQRGDDARSRALREVKEPPPAPTLRLNERCALAAMGSLRPLLTPLPSKGPTANRAHASRSPVGGLSALAPHSRVHARMLRAHLRQPPCEHRASTVRDDRRTRSHPRTLHAPTLHAGGVGGWMQAAEGGEGERERACAGQIIVKSSQVKRASAR
jgi:hypothetical protein